MVQEALLRVHTAIERGEEISSPRAYAATVATRLAIDELRSARARRETYVGEWLPEPVAERPGGRSRPAGRAGRLALPRLPRRARVADSRAAGRVPAPRRLRLRLRRGRRDHRHQRGERPAARLARPAPRAGGPAALRCLGEERASSSRTSFFAAARERANSRRSRRCSPRTSSCTATAAESRRRSSIRSSAAPRWPRCSATGGGSASSGSAGFSCGGSTVNGQPGAEYLDADGKLIGVMSLDIAEGQDPGDPLDRQSGEARPPRPGGGRKGAARAGCASRAEVSQRRARRRRSR